MKKKIFLFILLLSHPLLSQNTEAARKLLDEVSGKISSFKNMKFDFTYVLENRPENIRQETNGSVTISKDLYRINFLGFEQLFDGKMTYTIVPENEEITISDPEEESEFGINPSEILTIYKKDYAYQWDIKQNVMGTPVQFIKLIPNEEKKELKYLLLGIDMRTKLIYRLIEIGRYDTRTTLTLKNIKTNINLRDDFFLFDKNKYPDYYINN
ncbi:hypothetical protein DEJ39_07600 [Bacteroidetes bacterium SCGC AAA795-G10]|nr:hypothetical protein DEJ39_07600 [Bacteroidetes bacterium SCGC AAA795-G10]